MKLTSIDYAALCSGSGLTDLDRVCQDWGFFELTNHPISSELRERMLDAMAQFFALPTDTKRRCERTAQNHWGFYDRELTKNVQDWKELFDVGPEVGACVPQWPRGLDEFRAATEAFYEACEAIALQLVRSLGAALGTDGEALARGFENHTSYLRLNHYPLCADPAPADTPTGPPRGHLGISHHSDAGAVTVLLQDGNDGLQVERDGQWHSVTAERGSIVINIGDVVQVWSNDRYRAPLHRVLASDTHVRYSAPFFLNPSFATDYAPVGRVPHETPRYRAINWGEFRQGRAAGDYADVGEEIQIAHFRIG
ncbi:MAG: 2OG-Fe(II) oxygenase family protein [Myxococcota bacterium]|nr:2OG-Fe(II) oxygenase family protein [Myxococcota bacterium]